MDCPIVCSGIYNQKLVVIYVYSCDDVYIIVDVKYRPLDKCYSVQLNIKSTYILSLQL